MQAIWMVNSHRIVVYRRQTADGTCHDFDGQKQQQQQQHQTSWVAALPSAATKGSAQQQQQQHIHSTGAKSACALLLVVLLMHAGWGELGLAACRTIETPNRRRGMVAPALMYFG
jgi:hypothetical protein